MRDDFVCLRQFPCIFRWIAFMWIGYFALFAFADRFIIVRQPLGWLYFTLYGGSGLLLVILAYIARWRHTIPYYSYLSVMVLATLPIMIKYVLWKELSWLPWVLSAEQTSTGFFIRHLIAIMLPVFLAACLWQMWHVFAVVLWITAIDIFVTGITIPIGLDQIIVAAMIMRAGAVVGLGYLVNRLVRQMLQQQQRFEEANQRLIEMADSLERLTVSRERNRMARELHDTLAHTLSGLAVQLETVKAYLGVDPQTAGALLEDSLLHARQGLDETRRALHALRATPLDDLGLVLALKQLAESTAERTNMQLCLKLPSASLQLPSAVEQVIYRVVQEAISNVAYHANATRLTLSLQIYGNAAHVSISDNGVGFQSERVSSHGHYGLKGMRERVQMVRGVLKIDGVVGEGTKIEATIPYQEAKEHARSYL